MASILQQVVDEMKSHPYTMLAVVGLILASSWGYGNYARAGEVAAVESKIDRVLEIQLAATLRQMQDEYCRANGSKAAIQDIIEDYQRQYRELTGRRYPLPACRG